MAYTAYNYNLKSNSRKLRNNSTLSEVLLWKKLRAGSLMGFKFNRQKPLANYIVDFYCKSLNLVIEVDGGYHNYRYKEDLIRQENLESLGLTVLRFTNEQVKKEIDNVIRGIEIWIDESGINPPNPLSKGE